MAILESIPYRYPAPELTIVPAIPEVTKCVVLTGSPVKPELPIKAAETNSADAPCAGVRWIFPSLSPSVVTILL